MLRVRREKMNDIGLSVVRNTAEHRRTTRAKLAKSAGTKKCLICFHLKSEQAPSSLRILLKNTDGFPPFDRNPAARYWYAFQESVLPPAEPDFYSRSGSNPASSSVTCGLPLSSNGKSMGKTPLVTWPNDTFVSWVLLPSSWTISK